MGGPVPFRIRFNLRLASRSFLRFHALAIEVGSGQANGRAPTFGQSTIRQLSATWQQLGPDLLALLAGELARIHERQRNEVASVHYASLGGFRRSGHSCLALLTYLLAGRVVMRSASNVLTSFCRAAVLPFSGSSHAS